MYEDSTQATSTPHPLSSLSKVRRQKSIRYRKPSSAALEPHTRPDLRYVHRSKLLAHFAHCVRIGIIRRRPYGGTTNVCVRKERDRSAFPIRATKSPTNDPNKESPGDTAPVPGGRLTHRRICSSISWDTGLTSTVAAKKYLLPGVNVPCTTKACASVHRRNTPSRLTAIAFRSPSALVICNRYTSFHTSNVTRQDCQIPVPATGLSPPSASNTPPASVITVVSPLCSLRRASPSTTSR